MSIICTYWIIMFNYRPRWAFSNNLLYYPSLYGCLSIYIYTSICICIYLFLCLCSYSELQSPLYLSLLLTPPALVYYETLAHVGHYFSGVNNYKYYYRFVRLALLLRYYYCHSKSSQIINNKCIQISRI